MSSVYVDIAKTVSQTLARSEHIHPQVMLDFDQDDNLIGIEILGARQVEIDDEVVQSRTQETD